MRHIMRKVKKRVPVSRRCIKFQLFILVFIVFALVHFRYIISVDRKNFERMHSMPDSLMKFPERRIILNETKILPTQKNNFIDSKCQPRRSIVFLKTHKTGSTTMTNIFLRYAEKYKLSVGLPPERKWELAGYPAYFNKGLIDPQLKQYDMLCHHFRFDKSAVSEVVSSDAFYVTILRDPANEFESRFSFFRDGPFSVWMPDYGNANALEKFLNDPNKYYNKSTPWYFIAKNYQSFDLGFDNDKESDEYIDNVLEKMNKWFDLVLITEKYEESLILLKDHLCMDSLEDILYLRLKVRQNSTRRKPNEQMKNQMRNWNKIDTKLYEYFFERLEKKINEYGKEKMEKEVDELKKMLDETEKRCVLEYNHHDLRSWISRIIINKASGELCNKLSWGEVKFGDYVRKSQKKFLKIPEEDQIPAEEMKRLLEAEQKRVLKS